MIKVDFIKGVSGNLIPLDPTNVFDFDFINMLSKTKPTEVEIHKVDGTVITGTIIYSASECKYHLQLDKFEVIGKGSCIVIDTACDNEEKCFDGCANKKAVLTDDTKIPVLDENGCPTQEFTTLGDIKKFIIGECLVPEGNPANLVAGDAIVAIDDDCNFKRIDPEALCCRQNTGNVNCNECP